MLHDAYSRQTRRAFLRGSCAAVATVALDNTLTAQTSIPFTEHHIPRGTHHLYAREYDGNGPAFVLLHGFPDDLHIFDRLIPNLVAARRRVVAFDFLGYGASDKPEAYAYSFEQQRDDLVAVADALKIDKLIPVAHDAGGVAAIDYVLRKPDRTSSLCLLNTFFGDAPTLKFPELITLFATPDLKDLANAFLSDPKQMAWLRHFQNHQHLRNSTPELKALFDNVLQPIINENFAQKPSAGPAFARMTSGLYPAVKKNNTHLSELKRLDFPVSIIWGQRDPYLNVGVARDFADHFKKSSLHLLDAGHWPQIDRPQEVARYLLSDTK
jgi:pimeloyl-ACP methyl ester carboxylesterase